MESINFPFSLQIQKVHFCLDNFKKLDLVRFEEQMGRAGIKHTYNVYLFITNNARYVYHGIPENSDVPLTVRGPILVAS